MSATSTRIGFDCCFADSQCGYLMTERMKLIMHGRAGDLTASLQEKAVTMLVIEEQMTARSSGSESGLKIAKIDDDLLLASSATRSFNLYETTRPC